MSESMRPGSHAQLQTGTHTRETDRNIQTQRGRIMGKREIRTLTITALKKRLVGANININM